MSNLKELKIIVRDLRKEIPDDLMKQYEQEFFELKMNETEESKVKKDPEENFLFVYEKEANLKKFNCQVSATKISSLKKETKRFKCQSCKRTFKLKNYFKRHICLRSLTCSHCNVKLANKGSFKAHMKNIHNIQVIKNGYICDFCGENFTCKSRLKKHFEVLKCRPGAKFSCDYCGKEFDCDRKPFLKMHMISHVDKVKCKICHSSMRSDSIKKHNEMLHSKGKRGVNCNVCSKSFRNSKCLKDHMRHHNKKFDCSACQKKFLWPSQLAAHMIFHDNPDQLRCKICGHQSTRKRSLKQHLNIHEANRERKFDCDQCDFKTYEKQYLEGHKKVKH